MSASASDAALQPRLLVYFGDTEVGAAVENVQARSAVNKLASADFMLDLALVPEAVIDFFAEVRIVAEHEAAEYPLFTGNVVDAEVDGEVAHVRCGAGIALEENLMPPFAAADVRGVDMLYLILREVGFTEERMQLNGLDELPVEPFEVTVPIDGATAQQQKEIAGVRLLPPDEVESALNPMPLSESHASLVSAFAGAPLYARAFEVGSRAFDVEQQALREIDTALAWLGVRAAYGLGRLPSGDAVGFRRAEAHARPTRRNIVLLRGLETRRRWLRAVGTNPERTALPLVGTSWLMPALPPTLTPQDRQALLACRRAAGEGDPLGRVNALWDAIEFYVASTQLPPVFTKSELKAIRQGLPAGMSEVQLQRVEGRLAELNAPPLQARLTAALAEDSVPISDDEMGLLRRLRHLRNDAVHGRGADLPRIDELERAISIVSRMLVFRINRRSRDAKSF